MLATRGRLREAVAEVERAVATDPLSSIAWGYLGRTGLTGAYAKARESAQHSLDLDSEGQYAIDVIPESYILEHEPQRALDFISEIQDQEPRLFVTAIARDALDQTDAADAALKQRLRLGVGMSSRSPRSMRIAATATGHSSGCDAHMRRIVTCARSGVPRFSRIWRLYPRYPAPLAEWKLAD